MQGTGASGAWWRSGRTRWPAGVALAIVLLGQGRGFPGEDASTADAPSIGSDGPLRVVKVDYDGRWVVLCQEPQGQDGEFDGRPRTGARRMDMFLVIGSGRGNAIDEYICASANGRTIAVVRDGTLFAVDVVAGPAVVLAEGYEGRPSLVSFDQRGRLALFAKPGWRGEALAVRDLRSGEEHIVEPDGGTFSRAALDPSGSWVLAEVLDAEPPSPEGRRAMRLPDALVESDRVGRGCETEPTFREKWGGIQVGRVGDPKTRRMDGLVGILGTSLVVQDGEGLWRRDGGGARERFPGPGKDWIHLAYDPMTVVAFHEAGEDAGWIVVHRAEGKQRVLEARPSFTGPGVTLATVGRGPYSKGWITKLLSGSETLFLHLTRGTAVTLRDRMFSLYLPWVVLVHGQVLEVLNLETEERKPIPGGLSRLGYDALRSGPYLAGSGVLIDVRSPEKVRHYEGVAVMLSWDGRILVASGRVGGRTLLGPLRWVDPR